MTTRRPSLRACLFAHTRDRDFGVMCAFATAFGAAAIVGLSGRPLSGTALLPNDKILHIAVFGALALTLVLALHHLGGLALGLRSALAVVVVTAFGATDEWHQSIVDSRVADVWDVVADGVGAMLFCGLAAVAALMSPPQTRAANPVMAAVPPPNLPRG